MNVLLSSLPSATRRHNHNKLHINNAKRRENEKFSRMDFLVFFSVIPCSLYDTQIKTEISYNDSLQFYMRRAEHFQPSHIEFFVCILMCQCVIFERN